MERLDGADRDWVNSSGSGHPEQIKRPVKEAILEPVCYSLTWLPTQSGV